MEYADRIISIGIDQGTTGTTILAVDANMNIVAEWYKQHTQYRPASGLLEHDPQEILDIVAQGVSEVIKQIDADTTIKLMVGLANQGETVCLWDCQTGKPLHNAIVWSDSRGTEIIDSLSADEKEEIRQITGLEPDSYFSASKIAWLMNNVSEVQDALKKERLMVGTLDSWLIWKLSGGKVYYTDPSTASRTMLYDIAAGKWSKRILEIFGLSKIPLADVKPSVGRIAQLTHHNWNFDSLPLTASITDQPASLFAHCCWEKGQAKITYGTGCFLLVNAGKKSRIRNSDGLTNSIGWDIREGAEYIIDGAVYSAGSVIEWLTKDCGWVKSADEIDNIVSGISYDEDLSFVPAMDGLSAPYWRRDVKGVLCGLTLATQPAHIIRAALDGIAHQVADIVETLPDDIRNRLIEIKADGGLSRSSYLMQKQADVLGVPITVTDNCEMTALGVSALAMIGAGLLNRPQLRTRLNRLQRRTFEPKLTTNERLSQRNRWKRAIKLAISATEISKQEST